MTYGEMLEELRLFGLEKIRLRGIDNSLFKYKKCCYKEDSNQLFLRLLGIG